MNSGLLATKLHRPSTPPKRVQRPHLIRRLDEGLESGRQITLVSAPAGFGKTTCISQWLDTLDRPATWLSLDAADDDPGRFFTYLVAALQGVDDGLGREIKGVLRAGQLPPGEVISTTLCNDILDLEFQFVLVLDDLHVIQDRLVMGVLERLVANLPLPLHLVLITREDPPLPLARLRANNQLTEIRAMDLRFDGHDAERFLSGALGLCLSPSDIALLEEKTEGWIVGLQLAGLTVRDRADPSSFIATLRGSHRFILSYLTEEVLSQQPEEIQSFLLQTSILDKLNGELCNVVTGRSDGRALLERLFSANLFLVPLDDEQQWYRYHHLFADLLRDLHDAVQKASTAELHRRASRWFAQENMANEAIGHALAAADYATAADLLESHATGMIMQGYAKTVNGWVQAIPAEWRSQSPRIYLAFAWMHALRGNYTQACRYLDRLQVVFADSRMEPHQGAEISSVKAEWLALRSLMLNMQGKAAESMKMATQALETAPHDDSHVRSLAYFGLAGVFRVMREFSRAAEAYQMAIQHGRTSGNSVAEMMSIAGLAEMALEHGQLHFAFEIAFPVSERVERSGSPPPISAVVHGALGQIYLEWYQTEQARGHILRAIQLSALGGYNSGATYYRGLLSRLLQLEGDLLAAAQEVEKAASLMQGGVSAEVREEVVAQQVRIYLALNRPAAAEIALQGQGFYFRDGFSFPDLPDQSITHSLGLLCNSSLRFLLHQARVGRNPTILGPGFELADRLISAALQGQAILVALEALLLRAQMHAALGDSQSSEVARPADCARALELAEPEGYVSVFVEQGSPVAEALAGLLKQDRLGTVQPGYVERILVAFPGPQSRRAMCGEPSATATPLAGTRPVALIEPLTDRELDVLRLMAEGLKYREIATRLFISLNTVRSHVKAIYGKLNVNNRTQAIETARRQAIL